MARFKTTPIRSMPDGMNLTVKKKPTKRVRVTFAPPSEHQIYVGRDIYKEFDGKMYKGRVTYMRVLKRTDEVRDHHNKIIVGPLFRIDYDDGDTEELELHEIKRFFK